MSKPNPFAPLRAHVVDTDPKPRRKRKKARRRGDTPEAREQKRFVRWARDHGLEVQHQNNGASTKARRIHLHQMGCTAGAADILIFNRPPRYPNTVGVALEFKSQDGEQTPDQEKWEERIAELGWAYHVVRSAADAIWVVNLYELLP